MSHNAEYRNFLLILSELQSHLKKEITNKTHVLRNRRINRQYSPLRNEGSRCSHCFTNNIRNTARFRIVT
jgi:hypothetical protein